MYTDSSYLRLIKLSAEYFPNIKEPVIEFESSTDTSGEVNHRASMRLLGQLYSSPYFGSKEEASEYLCDIATEVLKQFNRLVLLKTSVNCRNDPLFSIFESLKLEAEKVCESPSHSALRLVSSIKNRLIDAENEQIEKKIKDKAESIQEKMMKNTLPANEIASMKRGNVQVEESLILEKVEPSPKRLNNEALGSMNIGAPIPALFEFAEKQMSKESILYDDFVKGINFGCRIVWGKKFWVAPAIHRQKKEARNYAAVMACVELFGEGFIYEGIDPDLYRDWTRDYVRSVSDKYSFATSDELLNEVPNVLTEKYDSDLVFDFSNIKIEPLSDGKKFLSVVNEICQKMRFTPPNYVVSSVNSLTNYYVCSVKNFHDLPHIESSTFTKKNDAKEDAAGKIYHLLKMKGIIDEASRIVGTRFRPLIVTGNTMSDLSCAVTVNNKPEVRNIPIINHPADHTSPSYNAQSPPPVPCITSPPDMNNQFMNPMMQMFMMSQVMQNQNNTISSNASGSPSMPPPNFEAMMEMTRQWQAFLAWQQQQQQQKQQSSCNFSEKSPEDENKKQ